MRPFSFPGTYLADGRREEVRWTFQPSTREGWAGRYEIRAVIRGVQLWGGDLDGLEPASPVPAQTALALDRFDELTDCVITGELPCTVLAGDEVVASTIGFTLDLRRQDRPDDNLTLSCVVHGVEFTVSDDWFEDGLLKLGRCLPEGVRIRACITCLFSDYSPAGHGLMGMRCHRDSRERYLAVRSKGDYWSVPVTEDVPETYLCPEFQERIPGTGYRG